MSRRPRTTRKKKRGGGVATAITATVIVGLLAGVIGVAVFVMTGGTFGEPTIDGSSEQAMKRSLETIVADMTDKQKEELLGAMLAIQIYSAGDPDKVGERFDGMTADEVLAMAERLKAENAGVSLHELMQRQQK